MIAKLLWVSVIFLVTLGIIFIASFGIEIPVAYYEKSETIVAS